MPYTHSLVIIGVLSVLAGGVYMAAIALAAQIGANRACAKT